MPRSCRTHFLSPFLSHNEDPDDFDEKTTNGSDVMVGSGHLSRASRDAFSDTVALGTEDGASMMPDLRFGPLFL